MKRSLLSIMFILFLCKPVYAQEKPARLTVKEAYLLVKKDPITLEDQLYKMGFIGYFLGVTDYAMLSLTHKNKKATYCVSRPISVWFDIVFDAYQKNKISGDDYFLSKYIQAINEICKVKLWD